MSYTEEQIAGMKGFSSVAEMNAATNGGKDDWWEAYQNKKNAEDSKFTNNNESTTEVRSFQSLQSVYSQWEIKLEDHAQLSLYAPENYHELLDAWDDAENIYADLLKDESRLSKSYSIFSSLTYAEAFDEKIALIKSNYDSILVLKKNMI